MKNQTIFIALGAALAGVLIYFLYKKGKTTQAAAAPAASSAASSAGLNAKDKTTFKALSNVLEQHDKTALNWVLPMVDAYWQGEAEQAADTLVNGQKTLSGSFMSAFFAGYNVTNPNQALYDKLMRIFTQFKQSSY